MLCHGNAFWVGLILLAWYLLDYGATSAGRARTATRCRRPAADVRPVPGGGAGSVARRPGADRQLRRRSRARMAAVVRAASDRRSRPSATAAGTSAWSRTRCRTRCCGRSSSRRSSASSPSSFARSSARVCDDDGASGRAGRARLLILAVGGAFIFAAFINNKVPVYCRTCSIGFSLAAGFAVSEAVNVRCRGSCRVGDGRRRAAGRAVAVHRRLRRRRRRLLREVVLQQPGRASWCPTRRPSATLRALVPAGPKYLYASPQFWTPFHDEPGTTFYSYAAAQPVASRSDGDADGCGRGSADLPDRRRVSSGCRSCTGIDVVDLEWQRTGSTFIEPRCALDGVALRDRARHAGALPLRPDGSAARAERRASSAARRGIRSPSACSSQRAGNLARWTRYEDPRGPPPRSRPSAQTDRRPRDRRHRLAGHRARCSRRRPASGISSGRTRRTTRDGDLLYLGTWQQPQVRSLSGASSSGIAAPLIREPWFPHDRAFEATARGGAASSSILRRRPPTS